PELPREKRGAYLHLAIGRPHVEEPRGADRATRGVPYLRIDDRLAARHRVLRVAYEDERVVGRPRRLTGEIAADFLIAHRLEDVRRVSLVQRLEREPAAFERDRGQVHMSPNEPRGADQNRYCVTSRPRVP